MDRRPLLAALVTAPLVGAALWWLVRLPPLTTPEGAYVRLATAMRSGDPADVFASLDTRSQTACERIGKLGTEAVTLIESTYPDAPRMRALARFRPVAGSATRVWSALAAERGWLARLRKDLSGVAEVEGEGDDAVIVTVRGTRYPFHRGETAWGLSAFTAQLEREASRMVVHLKRIREASTDYRRAEELPAR